jgi:hypothetical protein
MSAYNFNTCQSSNLAYNLGSLSAIDGGGFNPAQILSLALWLDGADQTAESMDIISNKCASWLDKSSNGYIFPQPDAAKRPATNTHLLNGLPVLTFDGTNDWLQSTDAGLLTLPGSNATVFVVARQSAAAQERIFTFATSGNSTRSTLRFNASEGCSFNNNSSGTMVTAPSMRTNDFNIIYALHSSTTQSIGANGGSSADNSSATNEGSIAYCTIGADGQGTTNFLTGDIAEIIIYNRALTATEHSQIVRYLYGKWGVMIAGRIDLTPIWPENIPMPLNMPTYDGYTITHDFDVEVYKNAVTTQYYTATTGNNSNNGLSDGAATHDVDKIIEYGNLTSAPYQDNVAAGLFDRNWDWTATPTEAFNCIGYGGDATNDSYQTFATMTADAGAYKTARSAVGQVYDATILDSNGTQERLTLVADAATCRSTAGSWYTDNVTVWVHTSDSRDLSVDATGMRIRLNVIGARNTSDVPLYLENMNFYGWKDQGFYSSNAGSNTALYAKNCEFGYAIDSNNLTVQGTNTVILQGCVSRDSYLDGFNYHVRSGFESVKPNVYEFDCYAYDSGYVTGSGNYSNNCSTIHDGCFGFRITGEYIGGGGRNVQDIGIGTITINLDCYSHDSRGGDVNSCVDWMAGEDSAGDSTTMYLIRCKKGGSSTTPLRVGVDAIIYCNAGSAFLYQSANIVTGQLKSFMPRII